MKISDIIEAIELFSAPELQEEYDNAGLIIGDSSVICSGVLCALDVTPEIVKEAFENKCNLIIAHHPVIFKGIKKINGKTYVEKVIIDAIKNDIAIYAVHTNLDNVLSGVNGMIARKLNLKDLRILQPKVKTLRKLITFAPVAKAESIRNAVFAAGAGHIGNYSECSFNSEGIGTFKARKGSEPYIGEIGIQHQEKETKIEIVYPFFLEQQVVKALIDNHPYEEVAYDIFTMENVHNGIGSGIIGELEQPMNEEEFIKMIRDKFNAEGIRYTALKHMPVKKVAVCGGSGSFLIRNAIQQGADIFITGDVKYHEFFEAEGRIIIADIGHYESEQFTVDLLYDLLVEKFPTFAVLKTSLNTNPIRYLDNKS